MRRELRKLGRVMTLTSSERADLLRAQWAVMIARLELRTRAPGTWVRRQSEEANDVGPPGCRDAPFNSEINPSGVLSQPGKADRARALELAVRRAASYGLVRTTCLIRATALQRLLERDGIRGSQLRVGVRRTNDHLAAHAWLELGEMVLGDQPQHVRTFTATDLRLVRR